MFREQVEVLKPNSTLLTRTLVMFYGFFAEFFYTGNKVWVWSRNFFNSESMLILDSL